MYKKVYLFIFLFLMSLFLSINSYNQARKSAFEAINIEFIDKEIEFNTELSINDIVLKIDNAVLKENAKIKTDTIGKQVITISLKSTAYKDIQKDITHEIKIIDTVSPTIKGKDVEIMQGEEFNEDMLKLEISDNYSENIKIEKKDDINIEEPGQYTFNIKAIDESNNVTEELFNITIKEKPKVKTKKTISTSSINNVSYCKYYTDNIFTDEYDFTRSNKESISFKNVNVFLRGYVDNCVIQSYENEFNSLPDYLSSSPSVIAIYGRYIDSFDGINILGQTALGTSISIAGNSYYPGVITHEVIHAFAGRNNLDNTNNWVNIYNNEGNNLGKDTAETNNQYEYFVTAYKLFLNNPQLLSTKAPSTYEYIINIQK